MAIRIALAGNPNCGKTTMFNALTGARQYVGNWPGVTVEKKEGVYRADKEVTITDLPGVYSLSPFSPEEIVTRDYLLDGRPDAVISLVDATNLERNLYLTSQVLDLGLPVVVAVNMMDLVAKNGDKIDLDKLAKKLGCPVVPVSALKGHGLDDLMKRVTEVAARKQAAAPAVRFTNDTEQAIRKVQDVLGARVSAETARWYAIKLLEGEERTVELLGLPAADAQVVDGVRAAYENVIGDDAESAITTERYDMVGDVVSDCYKRSLKGMSTSEKADRIITSRILGLPIFVAVMYLVYYIAIGTVGTNATDWVNDNLFDSGWLITGTERFDEDAAAHKEAAGKIEAYLAAAEETGIDTEGVADAIAAEEPTAEDEASVERFIGDAREAKLMADYEATDEETNETTVTPVGAADFERALEVDEPNPADYGLFMPSVPQVVEGWLDAIGAADWVKGLVLDGVVSGVGAVLGFLPQMAVLFLELAILEGCGYMARIAFLMDRIFRRFGLSGKSFIPILVASGCGVPAVMATKTIEDERDRRMTIMTSTMIPCSAKTPIIALIFGSIASGDIKTAQWVTPLFYFLGVVAIIVAAMMLRKTKWFAGEATPFVMELPAYHVPSVRNVLMSVWDRCKAFVIKAGTVIFLSAIVVWFLLGFGVVDGSFGLIDTEMEGYIDHSLMAMLGNAVGWVFIPLGFGGWEATVTSITGLVAKENVVSTVGIITALGADAGEGNPGLWSAFAALFNGSVPAMVAFCAFNLLCAPCFAAIGAIRNQMASAKWFWLAIGFMTAYAWVVGFILYQVMMAVQGEPNVIGLPLALVALGLMLFQMLRPMPAYDAAKNLAEKK
ncbi:ferrous iron transporter B [Berryella wangjianweii]|uniref:Fe(2+) transporter FeoB n=1 Tax=Berryella wangjianweii TaxID=2734634 RepID=A0A6M8J965_9ACTN|nr:ferrous iron transporter B [Berryella wangjianweii]QKF07352.1 ferrous iron transporter B [Berryella wangjianweii]